MEQNLKLQKTHLKYSSLITLIVINVAVIALMIALCLSYAHKMIEETRGAKINSFKATVITMEKTAYGFLENHQVNCNDWAKYINRHRMTAEQAIKWLSDCNSNEDVSAHLVSSKTLTGISTSGAEVDYRNLSEFGFDNIVTAEEGRIQIRVSNRYLDPTDGESVVGFSSSVILLNDNNEPEEYHLIRVIPAKKLRMSWSFPPEFEGAEIALIKPNGNYIIRSFSLNNTNFWEYLQTHNKLSDDECEALTNEMLGGYNVKRLTDANGKPAYYVCCSSEGSGEWYFVGYIPSDYIDDNALDWTLPLFVGVCMLLLFVFNCGCILLVNRRLKLSAEKIRQADIAKTQFLSSMSHDIRTPMNAIIGMTTIASRDVEDPAHVRECLSKITLASNHLLTLVNDILDISKVESGKMTLVPVVFSLQNSITNLANIVRPDISAKALEFDIHLHNIRYENIFADELRINQIFINILSNAVKYTPPGGKVTLDLEERLDEEDPKYAELIYTVNDTGIGISEQFQKSMYEAFSRAVDTRVDRIQGSGLGLAIVKQMVDMMDGSIECESELGKGTKFVIRLRVPIAEKLMEELVLPPMDMLIVDDDEVFLKTAEYTFESLGIKVESVNNGRKAAEMVAERHEQGNDFTAIIIDWKMPDMDGVETTRLIREKVGKDMPIIIISSYDWTEIEHEALAAGANSFINKPLFRSTVYAKLNELLRFDESRLETVTADNDDYKGLHMLVAEDNDLNWDIIKEILDFYGITTDRAVNGEICVDMLNRNRAGTYDCILMDVQMPVMNGREASRAIRALSDANKNCIPIIAMTADAFAEDVKACFDAGMNGHVAKPIDLNQLFNELSKAGVRKNQN